MKHIYIDFMLYKLKTIRCIEILRIMHGKLAYTVTVKLLTSFASSPYTSVNGGISFKLCKKPIWAKKWKTEKLRTIFTIHPVHFCARKVRNDLVCGCSFCGDSSSSVRSSQARFSTLSSWLLRGLGTDNFILTALPGELEP